MAITPTPPDDLCAYTQQPNGIHELTLKTMSAATVQAFFAHLNHIFDDKTPADPPLLILVDSVMTGLPPLNQLMPGGRDLVARHPQRPLVRYALLAHGNTRIIMSTLETFIKLFRPSNKVRTFHPSQRSEAINWLLSVA